MTAVAVALLIVGLLAPLAVLVPSFGHTRSPEASRRFAQGGNAVSLVAWLAVLGFGLDPELGALAPDALAVAVAAGAALVALAVASVGAVDEVVATGIGLTVVAAGACITVDGAASVPVLGLAMVGVVAADAIAARPRSAVPVVAAGGLALIAVAVRSLTGTSALPAGERGLGDLVPLAPEAGPLVVLALGCALAAVTTAGALRRPLVLLLPGLLVVALRVLPAVRETDEARGLTVVVACGATALAVVAQVPWLRRRLAVPWAAGCVVGTLSVWALAAAAMPRAGAPVGAALLAAAAVVAVGLPSPIAPLVGLPGAAVLAGTVGEGGRLPIVITVLLLITGWGLAQPVALRWLPETSARWTVTPPAAAAGAVGLWLVVLPTTWSWAWEGRAPALDRYQDGALVVVAAALLTAVGVAIVSSRARLRTRPAASVGTTKLRPTPQTSEGSEPAPTPRFLPFPAAAATLLLLGLAGWLLLASLLR